MDQTATAGPDPAVLLHVTYYTDPLCCWSWAFEPEWSRLRRALVGRMAWRLRMGGMIRRWDRYEDPLNAIHRPAQMGPLWMQAERQTGVRIESRVWTEDPPDSSWPACLAFKAAELQSAFLGDVYLKRMRRALFIEGLNIARREVLSDIAAESAAASGGSFDAVRWERDMDGEVAKRAFQKDMTDAHLRGIGRFPTLILRRPIGGEKLLTGWRPYEKLVEEVVALVPEFRSECTPEAESA
ncbi:MAG TPA: DsbA family protein [Rhizobiaceae bacterium]|nr:DsbA family protein [Rhizobiaceae bacterium]